MKVSAMSELTESLLWDKLNELQALSQQANATSLAYKERRKELTRNTKEFKVLTDDEKLSQLPELLIQYQNELNQLTKDNVQVTSTVNQILSSLQQIIDPPELSSDNPYII
jgi:small-conductance mechanosensitive channel